MVDWGAFLTVFSASLVSACLGVILFSLALRFGGGEERRHKVISVLFFVAVGLLVVFGLYIIVGDHLSQLLGLSD